ncbi:MAG: hypothetical protein AAGA08_05360 [Pseudomonadota bacterium]
MVNLKRLIAPLVLLTMLAACITPPPEPEKPPDPVIEFEPEVIEDASAVTIEPGGSTVATLDTTTDAEKAAVTQVAAPTSGLLGETVAALGDPTKPGFWLRTPLVKSEQPGRIERDGVAVAQVTLVPLDGEATSGSQISLSAMRALDIGLTDLVTLKVYAG